MTALDSEYPVRLEIDPAEPQNRLLVFLRPILAIPHWIIIWLLGIVAFLVWLAASASIVVTVRYPEPLLRFTIGYAQWAARVAAYAGSPSQQAWGGTTFYIVTGGFLTGRYPPFTLGEAPDYPIRLHVQEQVEGRDRLTGFFPVRIIMAIPHIIVVAIASILITVATVVAWLAGIVLGQLPDWLHNFIAGWSRYTARVGAYVGLLADEYPPFSFN